MSRRAQDNLVGGIVLVVFLVFLYLTLGYSSRARLVPLPVSVLGIVLALAQLVWQNLRSMDELRINFLDVVGSRGAVKAATAGPQAGPGVDQARDASAAGQTRKPGGELSAFGLLASLLTLVFVVGPLPAVFIFTAGYLSLTKHCSLARAVLYALICAGVLYGLFGYILGVQLNRGLLSDLLPDYVDF